MSDLASWIKRVTGAYHGWSGSIGKPCLSSGQDGSSVVADAVHKDYMRQVRGKGEANELLGTYNSASSKSDSDSESELSDSSESEPELSSERLSKSCMHEHHEKQCTSSRE